MPCGRPPSCPIRVSGIEAAIPAHSRSAVGGDTRLFSMIYRGNPDFYPIIGTADGSYIDSVLETRRITGAEYQVLSHEEPAERYPQRTLRPDDCAIHDPLASVLRTDRAVSAAIAAARANGTAVLQHIPVDSITETENGVVVASGERTWTFEKAIIAAAGPRGSCPTTSRPWSRRSG